MSQIRNKVPLINMNMNERDMHVINLNWNFLTHSIRKPQIPTHHFLAHHENRSFIVS